MLTRPQIVAHLAPLFRRYAIEREENEHFGDYCHRIGAVVFEGSKKASAAAMPAVG